MQAPSVRYLCCLVILLVMGCEQQSGSAGAVPLESEPRLVRLPYTSQADGAEREFFVYLPRGYENHPGRKWPLLLFLHGNGERGNGRDELDFTLVHGPLYEAWIQKRDLPFIIVVPQLHMFGMDEKVPYIADRSREQIPQRLADGVPERLYMGARGEMGPGKEVAGWEERPIGLPLGWDRVETDLVQMLDQVASGYRVDKRRVYLTGLSYGGFGSWYMASRYPQRFAAVAPVAGWGHPDLMPSIADNSLPVWAFAGGRDRVVDKSDFYAGINRLEELGGDVRFTLHEDMPHDVWVRVYAGEDLYRWLLAQSLDRR
ncbi:alpha/beta fold hydrolase [Microbulbifer sp. JSM ZJ756]|uniref:carboxylesterase family protein n=1 Tax=Microbulbifer sp. JSM ZJ756 TaxID=3376191 RepID=UPI0037920046